LSKVGVFTQPDPAARAGALTRIAQAATGVAIRILNFRKVPCFLIIDVAYSSVLVRLYTCSLNNYLPESV
jgi:hypothetical protein